MDLVANAPRPAWGSVDVPAIMLSRHAPFSDSHPGGRIESLAENRAVPISAASGTSRTSSGRAALSLLSFDSDSERSTSYSSWTSCPSEREEEEEEEWNSLNTLSAST